jgi:hypothetical protein
MRIRSPRQVRGRHNAGSSLYLIVSKDRKNRRWAFRFTKISKGKVSESGLGDASLLTLADAETWPKNIASRFRYHACRARRIRPVSDENANEASHKKLLLIILLSVATRPLRTAA